MKHSNKISIHIPESEKKKVLAAMRERKQAHADPKYGATAMKVDQYLASVKTEDLKKYLPLIRKSAINIVKSAKLSAVAEKELLDMVNGFICTADLAVKQNGQSDGYPVYQLKK